MGLYSSAQEKYTTPYQYLVQIVVGSIIVSLGGMLIYYLMVLRSEEIRRFGFADLHVWGWIVSVAMVAVGLFVAHAGTIFFARKINIPKFRSVHKSHVKE